jgi:hypothetical protein
MPIRSRLLVAVLVFAAALFAPAATAQKFQPGSNYICPNNSDTALDCYLDAVRHLYTMCRHIKSIEVIEFGYEKAQQGVNGAKSSYCVDKQKINITRPYQAALLEATPSKDAVNGLRSLQELWLEALAGLTWKAGESDEEHSPRRAAVRRFHHGRIPFAPRWPAPRNPRLPRRRKRSQGQGDRQLNA